MKKQIQFNEKGPRERKNTRSKLVQFLVVHNICTETQASAVLAIFAVCLFALAAVLATNALQGKSIQPAPDPDTLLSQ